ncbi:hypothetical protein MF621_004182 (plasmid) [Bacillus velezensis]|uniref:hypothetical protein n=1 Tax=Bacillus velezensis TaxID=492670 RepID=UPI00202554C2|nr:hypothetical protein [Bacillus velezensis]UFD97671.1 hypothetical protein [Bacillus amyloliquefaciens]URJ80565.1 hypothetical protein MF621_004182 [Bacillus velezensis]WNE38937.1 hypothetical protein MF619_04405 [Bacillus velezensis]
MRKNRKVARARGRQSAVRSWSKEKVGPIVARILGDGSAGGEDPRLKERVCFRKIRRVQGNAGDRRPYSWAMAAPATKNCS